MKQRPMDVTNKVFFEFTTMIMVCAYTRLDMAITEEKED